MGNFVVLNDGTATGSIIGQIDDLVQGQSALPVIIDVQNLAGTDFPITGATSLGGKMQTKGTSTVVNMSGTLAVSSGGISWTTSVNDVGTAGNFLVWFDFTLNSIEYRTVPVELTIIEDPDATAAQNSGVDYVRSSGDTMTGLLQFSGTTHAGIRLLSLTTTERDALTPAEGDVIYNETTTAVQVYQGGAWVSIAAAGISNVVEDTTPQLGGDLDAQGNDITSMGDITFQTGASGGTLRTGTSAADLFTLQAYSPSGGAYVTVIELDAGNTVVLQIIADYLAIEDAADTTKHVEWDVSGATASTATTLIFVQTAARNITFPDETGTLLTNQGGTLAGTLAMADNQITRPVFTDYGETVNAIGSIGGGTQDIDLTLGNVVSGTVDTSTTTFTFSNPPASGTAGSFTLFLTNGGSQTVNWPATVDWAGGTAPTLTAAGVDILTFTTIDGGTIWYGFAAGLAMA